MKLILAAGASPEREKPLLISIESLAAMLGISPRSVWRRLSGGEMVEPIRIGNSVRWRLQDVEDWVAAGCPVPVSNQDRR
jgi:predicted DNA-binding transcriptional regulator AlpA